MTYSADAIANFFLDKAKVDQLSLDHMKLQKLVYFAHAWHCGILGSPLLSEPVEAWQYGPVIRSLYREFRDCGNEPISHYATDAVWSEGTISQTTPRIDDGNPPDFATVRDLLNKVWDVYKGFTAIQLSNLTHEAGSPWHQVSAAFNHNLPKGITIPNEAIRDYFHRLAAKTA